MQNRLMCGACESAGMRRDAAISLRRMSQQAPKRDYLWDAVLAMAMNAAYRPRR